MYGCESDGEEDLETTRKAELPQPTAAFANLAFFNDFTDVMKLNRNMLCPLVRNRVLGQTTLMLSQEKSMGLESIPISRIKL